MFFEECLRDIDRFVTHPLGAVGPPRLFCISGNICVSDITISYGNIREIDINIYIYISFGRSYCLLFPVLDPLEGPLPVSPHPSATRRTTPSGRPKRAS